MPQTEWGWLISEDELQSWILQNDDKILLINKPALVVCHPSKNGPCSSLVGACRELLELETTRLVARLDRETSGIILFAQDKLTARSLQMALERRAVSKTYIAILDGALEQAMEVDGDIGPDKKSIIHAKNCVKTDGKRQSAITRFTPLRVSSDKRYTLARIEPLTGRKHQIRVHAQHIGHSIIGDKLYGPNENHFLDFIENGWTESQAAELPINRHALHAYRMTFHLDEGAKSFTAPLTPDLARFCEQHLDLSEEQTEILIENA